MLASEVDFGMYVVANGYSGIAFWVDDWAKEVKEEMFSFLEEESGELDWGWDEVEIVSDHMVECYMVGDDRKFVFDLDDLTAINVNDFCRSCGQIGCSHG